MTAEKTGFECYVEERMREHEERIRLREMKTARQRGWHPSRRRKTSAGK